MDPDKALRRHKLNILETSCDESETTLKQDIADDKIELMCHESPVDYANGEMGRLGQVRSPFTVDCNQEFETEHRKMGLAIDGEFYELKNAKSFKFEIDKNCPRIKILKRMGFVSEFEKSKAILTEL